VSGQNGVQFISGRTFQACRIAGWPKCQTIDHYPRPCQGLNCQRAGSAGFACETSKRKGGNVGRRSSLLQTGQGERGE